MCRVYRNDVEFRRNVFVLGHRRSLFGVGEKDASRSGRETRGWMDRLRGGL